MSLYSGQSETYWKANSRKRKISYQWQVLGAFFLLCIIFIKIQNSSRHRKLQQELKRRKQLLMEIRPSATEEHYELCELQMRDIVQNKCQLMCIDEITSIPRPIMHQACSDGCFSSFFESSIVGCREGTEADAFKRMSQDANNFCFKYQDMHPKPDVISTCRKYHRRGTREGHRVGLDLINKVLDSEWIKIKSQQDVMEI